MKLSSKMVYGDDVRTRSAGHKTAREILNRRFSFDEVYEEVHLPGCPTELYLDFFIARLKLAVEINGVQHRQFVPYFHGTNMGFFEQKKRDAAKLAWCNLNGIKLLGWDDDKIEGWEPTLGTDNLCEPLVG